MDYQRQILGEKPKPNKTEGKLKDAHAVLLRTGKQILC